MFGLGMQELMIIGIVAVLLFGKRLPEVARSLGGSYREFKKGLSEFHTQMDYSAPTTYSSQAKSSSRIADDYDDYEEATAPKFELPPSEPKSSESASQ